MSFSPDAFGTPLVRLARFAPDRPLFGKVEGMLPTGSTYDRIAGRMVADIPDARVVVASGGSAALAFAGAATAQRRKLTVVVPKRTLPEHLDILRRYPIDVVLVDGPLEDVHAVAAQQDGFLCYSPVVGAAAQEAFDQTLGVELAEMIPKDGETTVLVAPVASGALLLGTAARMRAEGHTVETVGVVRSDDDPNSLLDGVIRRSSAPRGLTRAVVVQDHEAHATRIELARTEGILVGMGAAAAAYVARTEVQEGSRVIAVLVDAGDRYFSVDRKLGG